jgi:hypothetical protein
MDVVKQVRLDGETVKPFRPWWQSVSGAPCHRGNGG